MKLLYLLRHAKAALQEGASADHERPLSGRGRSAAERIGEWLASQGEQPELVLCSSSRRTRETLKRVASRLDPPPRVSIEEELYLASCEALLARIRALPDEIGRVLVVGHNPGMAELALLLASKGAKDLLASLEQKFPTSALAILRLPCSHWREVGRGARLEAFVRPKDLEA